LSENIVIKKNLTTLSATNISLLSQLSANTISLTYLVASPIFQRNFRERGIDTTTIFKSGRSPTQGFILRAGEGIFLEEGSNTIPFNSICLNLECTFTVNGDTKPYFVTTNMQVGRLYSYSGPNGNIPKWVIYNGTESDYITIRSIRIRECGSMDTISFSLEKIEDSQNDGDSLTAIKLDTASPDVSPSVLLRKQNLIKLYQGDARSIKLPVYRRGQYAVWGDSPGKVSWPKTRFDELFFTGTISLRQGDGIAIIQRSPSALGNFNVEIQFTTDSDISSTSKSTSTFIKPTSRQGFK